jgi:hypothetical protein
VGHYRIDRNSDTSYATAWSGELRFEAPDSVLAIPPGRRAELWQEGPGGTTHYTWSATERDAFSDWVARANKEDNERERAAANRYVSPEMTGWDDLDRNGRWDNHPEYGPVWYPTVVSTGWAPYREGHWAWVRPWGWTWVDDAPWGFAPFHYGRWALIGGSWGWVPGPIVPRPVYAPALVGYVGAHSGNVSLSIGFGSGAPVGWFPLGPREWYYPPYRYSPRYVQQINVINVVNPPPRGHDDRRATRPTPVDRPNYRYAQRPDAVTMVSEEQFRNARPIGRDRLDLTPGQMAQLQPVAASLNPPGRPAGTAPGPEIGRASCRERVS